MLGRRKHWPVPTEEQITAAGAAEAQETREMVKFAQALVVGAALLG